MFEYYTIKDSAYMYFVVSEDENEVRAIRTLNYYTPNAFIDTPVLLKKESFDKLLESGEISRIDPPTFYIVTTRDTYKIKDKLKSAGADWNSVDKFWYFKNEPEKKLCRYKEVFVYPFSGKRI
ncbi:hypothetical protein MHH92_30355 [Paenibacillus sp. FSL M7-1414]|uniref:hypothetical protein n=1 Tax=Paenibacillus sp. FSL M7-1414 TaxID=2921542 RepID=UPI0030F67946